MFLAAASFNLAPIVVGVIFSVLILIVLIAVARYHQKCIRIFVRKHFWPQVPVPDIYVQFFGDRNKSSGDANMNATEMQLYMDR